MVQLKYFGDDRDFFKYDLITFILKKSSMSNYVFIPMLTEHRNDNEGQKLPADKNGRSHELLQFMRGCPSKSLRHWENWVGRFADQYLTVEPVDSTFFQDNSRMAYWEKFNAILPIKNALIFIDPDTGLETGSRSYQLAKGRDKYLLDSELAHLVSIMDTSSVLMIYQHLSRNRNDHDAGVQKKMEQAIKAAHEDVLVCAYRENDLSFLFVMKTQEQYQEVLRILNGYHEKSTSTYKSMYGTPYVKGSSISYIHSVETGIDNEPLKKENKDNGITAEGAQDEDLTKDVIEIPETASPTGKKILKEELDFVELRSTMKKILYDRLKDSKPTHQMAMEKYGEVCGISASYMRQDKHTRRAVASALIDDMSNDDLVDVLWRNGSINPSRTIDGYTIYSTSESNRRIIKEVIGKLDKPKKSYWRPIFWAIWIPCSILHLHWLGYHTHWFTSFPLGLIENGSIITSDVILFALILYRFCDQVSIGSEYIKKWKERPAFPLWDAQGGDIKPWDIHEWEKEKAQ